MERVEVKLLAFSNVNIWHKNPQENIIPQENIMNLGRWGRGWWKSASRVGH